MVKAVPRWLFSSDFSFFDGRMQCGVMKRPSFSFPPSGDSGAVFIIDGHRYNAALRDDRRKWWDISGDVKLYSYTFVKGETEIASAKSHMRRGHFSFLVQCQQNYYAIEFQPRSLTWQAMIYESSSPINESSPAIGKIYPKWFRNRIIDLPERLPLFLKVFFLYLVQEWKDLMISSAPSSA